MYILNNELISTNPIDLYQNLKRLKSNWRSLIILPQSAYIIYPVQTSFTPEFISRRNLPFTPGIQYSLIAYYDFSPSHPYTPDTPITSYLPNIPYYQSQTYPNLIESKSLKSFLNSLSTNIGE